MAGMLPVAPVSLPGAAGAEPDPGAAAEVIVAEGVGAGVRLLAGVLAEEA